MSSTELDLVYWMLAQQVLNVKGLLSPSRLKVLESNEWWTPEIDYKLYRDELGVSENTPDSGVLDILYMFLQDTYPQHLE